MKSIDANEYFTHARSNSINKWASFIFILGCFLFVAAIIAWIINGPGWTIMLGAWMCLLLKPVLNGFSLIVRNAERELANDKDLPNARL